MHFKLNISAKILLKKNNNYVLKSSDIQFKNLNLDISIELKNKNLKLWLGFSIKPRKRIGKLSKKLHIT